MNSSSCSVLIFLFALLCVFSTVLCDGCKSEKPCKATCGGKSFDITGLIKDTKSVSGEGYTFDFSCSGKLCGTKSNSVVCQVNDNDGRQWSLGVANSTEWTLVSKSPLQVKIKYSDGEGEGDNLRSSQITIKESSNHSAVYAGEDKTSAVYSFSIATSSSNILVSQGVPPGIIGWVLILLCILGFVTYFIVGAILMYVIKGARGLEIIPQYMFWKDFPFLLKDGVMFIISPCYSKSNYEKI